MPDKPKKSWTFQVRFNDTEDPLKLFIRPSLNCMDQVGLFFNQYSLEIDDEGARVYIKSKFVRSLSEFWSQKLMFNVFQNIRSSSFISPQVFSTTLLLLQHHFSHFRTTQSWLRSSNLSTWFHPRLPQNTSTYYVSKNLTDIPQTSVSLQPLTLNLVVGGVMARLGPLIKPSSTSRRREVTVDPNKFNLSKSSLHSSWHAIQGDQKRLWIVISLWQTWKLRKMAKLSHFVKWHIMRFWYFDASEKVGEKILTF